MEIRKNQLVTVPYAEKFEPFKKEFVFDGNEGILLNSISVFGVEKNGTISSEISFWIESTGREKNYSSNWRLLYIRNFIRKAC